MESSLKFIGIIHSELKRLEDCPLLENENAPEAIVEIFNEFSEAIQNIKPGAELILFTWLHEADRTVLVTKPRNNPNAPLTGVFSTRSPDRPNPIGIHFVKYFGNKFNQFVVSNKRNLLDLYPKHGYEIKKFLKETQIGFQNKRILKSYFNT